MMRCLVRTLTGGPAAGASIPSYAGCRRAILSAMNFSPLSLEGDQKHTLASRPPETKCLPLPTKARPARAEEQVNCSLQGGCEYWKESRIAACFKYGTCHSSLMSLHGMLHHVQSHIVDCDDSILQPKRDDIVVLRHAMCAAQALCLRCMRPSCVGMRAAKTRLWVEGHSCCSWGRPLERGYLLESDKIVQRDLRTSSEMGATRNRAHGGKVHRSLSGPCWDSAPFLRSQTACRSCSLILLSSVRGSRQTLGTRWTPKTEAHWISTPRRLQPGGMI